MQDRRRINNNMFKGIPWVFHSSVYYNDQFELSIRVYIFTETD